MFLGTYEYRIDDKGRIALPPKFRDELRHGLVMAQGLEKCIAVFPAAEWDKMAQRMERQSLPRSKARRINRFTFATAFSAEIDGQGRIPLPAALRQYAGIESDAIVAGVNLYFEIWSKPNWENESNLMENQAWQIIEATEERS
jgi:MraZ protein